MTSEPAAPDGDPASTEAPAPSPELLDLYKMAVEMADRVSARRGAANAFFLSVQTALLGATGITVTDNQNVPWWAALVLGLAGISISLVWWLQLRSYRVLSTAKFDIINAVEPRLPLQVFSAEWKILTRNSGGPWWTKYTELGATERKVPWVFAALHAGLVIGILCT
ncbi:hypothetical protein GCM10022403_053310 [Streptomyces coacervatus]|uniref:Small integral membrane protein n=1 Tax=Streptomyces coacervatus TaxID=647381 RepID=A0ABP7I9N3_9ACTN|nr:hypothetical protein [Streptomyces coacervatus]MDF2272809.1 hypothetical protein [Streptomyces coacervatus]